AGVSARPRLGVRGRVGGSEGGGWGPRKDAPPRRADVGTLDLGSGLTQHGAPPAAQARHVVRRHRDAGDAGDAVRVTRLFADALLAGRVVLDEERRLEREGLGDRREDPGELVAVRPRPAAGAGSLIFTPASRNAWMLAARSSVAMQKSMKPPPAWATPHQRCWSFGRLKAISSR